MTKVLFILSAVIMFVAAFFAYRNGEQFTEARKAAIEANAKVVQQVKVVQREIDNLTAAEAELAKVNSEVEAESEKKKSQQVRLAQAESDNKRLQEALDEKNKQLAEQRVKLAKLPQGMKPETLVEDINNIKKSITDLTNQTETKKKEVASEDAKVVDARRALDEIARKIEERKKSFDRNSMTAQIEAVNADWGFVVINAGENLGITEATKLLVTRGSQIIGKLSIISVQGSRTVANILPETLASGLSIAPGDRVILENLYQ